MDLHNTQSHQNTATCCLASEFRNSQSKRVIRRQPLVDCVSRETRARGFLLPHRRLRWTLERNNHARTKRLLLPDIHNLLPCSRFLRHSAPFRSAKHPSRQSLVRSLDLIGYQRQKELTSGFRPVLSNLIMLFFPRFLLNSAIAGQISSRFNSVYFFSGCCSHSQSHEVSQKQ